MTWSCSIIPFIGHGARCKAAKEFKRFYPDEWDEGLVCYDSRETGGFDLADKKLAVLLAEIAGKGPHVAVLLDSCNSGNATRKVDRFLQPRPRVTHAIPDERPLESYLDGYYSKLLQQGESLEIPASRHILLAACERVQLALESRDHRGVFTTSLLDALAESGPDVTYADLFMRVRNTVRRYAENQTPQFETYQRFNAYSGFLGKAASGAGRSYNVYFDTTWKAECGAVHGLPSDPDKIVELALYRGDTLVGYAETVQVGAQESEVNLLDVQADPQEQLKGRITSLPVPPLVIHLDGDAQGIKVVRDCFASVDHRAYGFSFSTDKNATGYTLLAKEDELNLYDGYGCRLIQCVKECSVRGAERLFLILKQISALECAVALQNKSTQLDKDDAVAFQLVECFEDGSEKLFPDEEIILDVTKQGDVWREITVNLRVNNRTDQALHFALVNLDQDFSVQIPYNERIEPIDELFELIINDSVIFGLSLEEQEGDQATHIFMLIASTEKIDDFLLAQEGITIGETVNFTKTVTFGPPKPQKKIYRNEWFTKTLRVTLVRRLDQVGAKDVVVVTQKVPVASKPAADRPVTRSLREVTYREQKITIKGHTSFKADISLMGEQAGSRSVAGDSDYGSCP
ncbi:MAG: caspase family protein [Candidatus Electronema sp. VV]